MSCARTCISLPMTLVSPVPAFSAPNVIPVLETCEKVWERFGVGYKYSECTRFQRYQKAPTRHCFDLFYVSGARTCERSIL